MRSQLLPLNLENQLIGPCSIITLSLKELSFFTSTVECQARILISWWSCGRHIQHYENLKMHPPWIFCLSLSMGTCTVQLTQYQSVLCYGKVLLSHTMVPYLRSPCHGWKLITWYGSEILDYFSRRCWKTQTFKTPLIMHHIHNTMWTTNVIMRTLCQVTGHGNKL